MFRHLLHLSASAIAFLPAFQPRLGAQSAPMGTSIGSLTEVVGRDGIGDSLVGTGSSRASTGPVTTSRVPLAGRGVHVPPAEPPAAGSR